MTRPAGVLACLATAARTRRGRAAVRPGGMDGAPSVRGAPLPGASRQFATPCGGLNDHSRGARTQSRHDRAHHADVRMTGLLRQRA
jgi:hypothetical protein